MSEGKSESVMVSLIPDGPSCFVPARGDEIDLSDAPDWFLEEYASGKYHAVSTQVSFEPRYGGDDAL